MSKLPIVNAKQLEKLQTVLTNNLPQAIAYLGGAVKTFDQDGKDTGTTTFDLAKQ